MSKQNIQSALIRLSARSPLHQHLAYLLLGWVMLLGVKADGPPKPPLSLGGLVGAAIILLLSLALLGPVLNGAQPVMYSLGTLTGAQLSLLVGVLLNVWRYSAGRKELMGLVATD